jgi:hypothetical protein
MAQNSARSVASDSERSVGVIQPSVHRMLDFVTVVAFAAAPSALGLSGLPASVSYALACVHLLLTLLTRFSPDGSQPLALKIHGVVEMLVGPVLLVAPFALGWEGIAKTFYLVAGVVIVVVWALSAYGGDRAHASH